MQRRFMTIDCNYCKAEKVTGYCKRYGGVVTKRITDLHNCKHKFDGEPCRRLIEFDWIDTPIRDSEHLVGDAYRQTLKKKR